MPGIIVGIDGSEHSRHALEWAIEEAALRHAPLTVLAVHQAIAGYWGGPMSFPGDQTEDERTAQAAQQETDELLTKAGDAQPPSVSVQAVTGLPADELIKAAAGADMVVVGSRGAGGFRRLLMGSVSTQVAHHSPCPVVVIPAEAA
jgi:nucleotide-binding universal stress UspA family protein